MRSTSGYVKLSQPAHTLNLTGSVSNGTYGSDWFQINPADGSTPNEGAWTATNETYARSDIASRLEAAAGGGGGGTPTTTPGAATDTSAGGATSAAMAGLMGAGGMSGGGGAGGGGISIGAPSSANPLLGQRSLPMKNLQLAMRGSKAY